MKIKTLRKTRSMVGLAIVASFVASLLFGIGHKPIVCIYFFLLSALILLLRTPLDFCIFDKEHELMN